MGLAHQNGTCGPQGCTGNTIVGDTQVRMIIIVSFYKRTNQQVKKYNIQTNKQETNVTKKEEVKIDFSAHKVALATLLSVILRSE